MLAKIYKTTTSQLLKTYRCLILYRFKDAEFQFNFFGNSHLTDYTN